MGLLPIKGEDRGGESSDEGVEAREVTVEGDTEGVRDRGGKKAVESHEACEDGVERRAEERSVISSSGMDEEIDVRVSADDN